MVEEGWFRRREKGVTYLVPSSSMVAKEYYKKGTKRHLSGNINGAFADLDECIRLNPNHADALIRRGMIRAGKGELDEALKDMAKAIFLLATREFFCLACICPLPFQILRKPGCKIVEKTV